MKTHPRLLRALRRSLFLPACTALFASAAWAQTAAPVASPALPASATAPASGTTAPATPAEPQNPVVKLSPFQVQASSNDTGYYNENTLAGTRLNSKLTDLAASITVVTKQEMIDTAAVDMNDVFLYEANTEGIGNYTAYTISRTGGVDDTVGRDPVESDRIRGIGPADLARDYYVDVRRIPVDAYIIDSLEINRGPNAILFGIGGLGGLVNQSITQAILNKSSNEVSARTGSHGAFRSTINLNRSLVKDKLAIRFAALYDSKGYEQKPAYDIQHRYFGAVTYKPFANTSIRANFEWYHDNNRRPNAVTPQDLITPWIQQGSPTWNAATYTATVNGVQTKPITSNSNPPANDANADADVLAGKYLPPGLTMDSSTAARPTMFINQGQVLQWMQTQLGTGLVNGKLNLPARLTYVTSPFVINHGSTTPLFIVPGVSSKSVYDYDSINIQSADWDKDRAKTYNIEFEQKLAENLYLDLGWFRQEYQSTSLGPFNASPLYIDANTVLPDGSPNANFGRPYLQYGGVTQYSSPETVNTLRATLAYELDFTKNAGWTRWFGRHQFMGLAERREDDYATIRYSQAVTDPHTWTNPANIVGGSTPGDSIYGRVYVGNGNGQVTQDPGFIPWTGNYTLRWYDGVTKQWVNEPATLSLVHNSASLTETQTQSLAAALQSFFLKDKIVTTVGIRNDFFKSRGNHGLVVDPSTGLYSLDNLTNFGSWLRDSGNTMTAGVVVKPLSWLNFHYNESDNFTPIAPAVDNFGNELPLPTGKGQDYGFTLLLFHNKLIARVNWYKVTQGNSRSGGDINILAQRLARVDGEYFGRWATQVATAALGAGASAADIQTRVNQIMQLPANSPDSIANYNDTGFGATSAVTSRGMEIELIYNPVRNWNIKFDAGEQETVQTSISPSILAWAAQRLPVWEAAQGDAGTGVEPFWTTRNAGNVGSTSTPFSFYTSAVVAPLQLDLAQQGKVSPEERKWSWHLINSYTFTNGWFKNFRIGNSISWLDKGAIGYLGGPPDANGIISSLDPDKPVWDPARYDFGFWVGYTTKILSGKVLMHAQLNLMNAFQKAELRPVAVNPDGSPSVYRIIFGPTWALSDTFDF